jgi:hypothetical protein
MHEWRISAKLRRVNFQTANSRDARIASLVAQHPAAWMLKAPSDDVEKDGARAWLPTALVVRASLLSGRQSR